MAKATILPDYDLDERVTARVRSRLEEVFSVDYGGLELERRIIAERLGLDLSRHSYHDAAEAADLIDRVLESLERGFRREAWSHRNPEGWLPRVAVNLIVSSLEFLREGLPNERTMQSYRNRRSDFLGDLASIAVEAEGASAKHGQFYHDLGKQIAQAVLEHEAPSDARPVLVAAEVIRYEDIQRSACEQLVYFIGAGVSGPIKIGIAANPQARLSTLQTAHHEELSILAVTGGGRESEMAYHECFGRHRLKGEWFARVPEIEAEIARLHPPTTDYKR